MTEQQQPEPGTPEQQSTSGSDSDVVDDSTANVDVNAEQINVDVQVGDEMVTYDPSGAEVGRRKIEGLVVEQADEQAEGQQAEVAVTQQPEVEVTQQPEVG